MESPTFKVMVVERHHALRTNYVAYFSSFTEFEMIGFHTNIGHALRDVLRNRPDIVVMEVSLQDSSGLEAILPFKERCKGVRIIMVSESNDFERIKLAFKNGAQGYLTKPLTAEKLLHALTSIKEDGAAISNDIVRKVIANFQRKSYRLFSERENQIVDHLCQGATYKMIADKLFVTPSTVNFHIQNIYLKLDVNSKSEALAKLGQL